MPSPVPLPCQIPVAQALRELAARRDGWYGENDALGWFDGFWDFVTLERDRLLSGPSWTVGGREGYYLLVWERDGQPRLDIFFEDKDYRPGACAPWPVSSIYLDDGSTVPPSKLPPREFVPEHANLLRARGFTLISSYWGPHAHRLGPMDFTVDQLGQILDAFMRLLP